jgi:hypothetical protein
MRVAIGTAKLWPLYRIPPTPTGLHPRTITSELHPDITTNHVPRAFGTMFAGID